MMWKDFWFCFSIHFEEWKSKLDESQLFFLYNNINLTSEKSFVQLAYMDIVYTKNLR